MAPCLACRVALVAPGPPPRLSTSVRRAVVRWSWRSLLCVGGWLSVLACGLSLLWGCSLWFVLFPLFVSVFASVLSFVAVVGFSCLAVPGVFCRAVLSWLAGLLCFVVVLCPLLSWPGLLLFPVFLFRVLFLRLLLLAFLVPVLRSFPFPFRLLSFPFLLLLLPVLRCSCLLLRFLLRLLPGCVLCPCACRCSVGLFVLLCCCVSSVCVPPLLFSVPFLVPSFLRSVLWVWPRLVFGGRSCLVLRLLCCAFLVAFRSLLFLAFRACVVLPLSVLLFRPCPVAWLGLALLVGAGVVVPLRVVGRLRACCSVSFAFLPSDLRGAFPFLSTYYYNRKKLKM